MKNCYALLLMLFGSSSQAAEHYYTCTQCEFFGAQQIASNFAIGDSVLVHNPTNANAWHFDIRRVSTGEGCHIERGENPLTGVRSNGYAPETSNCQHVAYAELGELSNPEIDYAALYRSAYIFTNGTMKFAYTFNSATDLNLPSANDPRGAIASDVVNNVQILTQFKNQVANLMRSPAFTNALVAFLAYLPSVSASTLESNAMAYVTVVFPDGSKIDAELAYDGSVDVKEALDLNGEQVMVPSNVDMFHAYDHHYGSGQDASNFIENARNVGVDILQGGSWTRQVQCSRTDTGIRCARR